MITYTIRGKEYRLDTGGRLSGKEELEAAAIIAGLSTKESARDRGVSPETVKAQRASAKSKVGATSQNEFIVICYEEGWVSCPELAFSLGFQTTPTPKAQISRLRMAANSACAIATAVLLLFSSFSMDRARIRVSQARTGRPPYTFVMGGVA